MKIGLFLGTQISLDSSLAQQMRESAEQVRAARDSGFDLICSGQHFLTAPYRQATLLPFLARMAAEAGDMRVAASVVLVPLHNPVALAEDIATMDAICDGRFIFGIGLGYRDEEYAAFGMKASERVGRMREALEVMRRLWAGGEVEHDGKYYHVPRVESASLTTQKPHPPIWVAANSDNAIRRAARWGYPWLVNPHATMDTISSQLKMYQSVMESAGQSISELPMVREAYIAEDRNLAYTESRPYLESKYAAYAAWGQDKALPGEEDFTQPYEDLARDRFLLGSPNEIVSEIRRYGDELGVTQMIFRMQWPGMSQEQTLRQIDLMGRDVIPRVK